LQQRSGVVGEVASQILGNGFVVHVGLYALSLGKVPHSFGRMWHCASCGILPP
jgi:hypothetical protein